MSSWDIFLSGRLELLRGLDAGAVRRGRAEGTIGDDDLARPSGSGAPWSRVADFLEFQPAAEEPEEEEAEPSAGEFPPTPLASATESGMHVELLRGEEMDPEESGAIQITAGEAGEAWGLDESDLAEMDDEAEEAVVAEPEAEEAAPDAGAAWSQYESVDLPGWEDEAELEPPPVVVDEAPASPEGAGSEEEEEEEGLGFGSDATPEMEELDLTAMADIAMQMIMFLLVAATVVYFKTLEIPKPNPDEGQGQVAQGMQTLEELSDTHILVEIGRDGGVRIDHEEVPPEQLMDRLKKVRADSLRTSMLLLTDFATPHANAVRALDAANEIGLSVALAKPVGGPSAGR